MEKKKLGYAAPKMETACFKTESGYATSITSKGVTINMSNGSL